MRIVLSDIYNQISGIYGPNSANDPAALIGMNLPEDPILFDPTYDKIDLFFDVGVAKHTGMSLDNFLRLSREYSDYIALKCRKLTESENKSISEVGRNLDNLNK